MESQSKPTPDDVARNIRWALFTAHLVKATRRRAGPRAWWGMRNDAALRVLRAAGVRIQASAAIEDAAAIVASAAQKRPSRKLLRRLGILMVKAMPPPPPPLWDEERQVASRKLPHLPRPEANPGSEWVSTSAIVAAIVDVCRLFTEYSLDVKKYEPSQLANDQERCQRARHYARAARQFGDLLDGLEDANSGWLGREDSARWEPWFEDDGHGLTQYERLRHGVRAFEREAEESAEQAAARRERCLKRRKGALPRFFASHVVPCYERIYGRPARVSRRSDGGQPGGPFVRFAVAFFTEVGRPVKPETIASWLRRARPATNGAKRANGKPAAPF
jgi:hypothetical protein